MDKDPSLFSSLNSTLEKKIFVANNFALDIVDHGDVTCQYGCLVNMFHVPNISDNLLLISQLTQTRKIFKLWSDRFFIKNLKDRSIIAYGLLKPKD